MKHQPLVDEDAETDGEWGQDRLRVPAASEAADRKSVHSHTHSHASEDERRAAEEARQAAEEAERLKKPFRLFTEVTLKRLDHRERERKIKEEKILNDDNGRLVDGQIVFDEDIKPKQVENPKLADGQNLPESLGRFPRDMLSIPIEELDPNIPDKTFIAIAMKFKKLTIYRFTATNTLFLFSPWNPLRRICIRILTNQFFDLVILASIAINCITMIIRTDNQKLIDALTILEYIFQGVYCGEMFVKVISKGFVLNNYTYLRDGWNWLDFIVVILAFVTITLDSLAIGAVNLSGLRAFRVLRALKSISVVPGLRTIVNSLFNSLRMLAEVLFLMLFCIALFALFALQLYMGALRNKCVADLPTEYSLCNTTTGGFPINETCFNSEKDFKADWLQNADNYYTNENGDYLLCGTTSGSMGCPIGFTCFAAGPNPNSGYTHFDNFPWALLNAFQVVSTDNWEDVYMKITDTMGPWNMIFFMAMILLGSFYLMNLMLAVVSMAYEQEAVLAAKLAEEEAQMQADKDAEEQAKQQRKENAAALFDPKKLKAQLFQKQLESQYQKRLEAGEPELETKAASNSNGIAHMDQKSKQNAKTKMEPLLVRSSMTSEMLELGVLSDSNTQTKGFTNKAMERDVEAAVQEDDTEFVDDLPDIDQRQRRYLMQKYATLWMNKIRPDDQKLIDRNCLCCSKPGWTTYHQWVKFQGMVFKVANHGFFDLFITLCIICNTIIMACEVYDPCELCRHCPTYIANVTEYGRQLTDCFLCPLNKCGDQKVNVYGSGSGMTDFQTNAMDVSNAVFTITFTMEAVIKLTALSREYFNNPWNCFDLFIVIFSVPDIVLYFGGFENVPGISAVSSVVKVFRLMRIIKLAQAWGTMRTLLTIIFQTFGALGNLVVILLLVMFIFSVLGNQLLGESYIVFESMEGGMPRWHFYDFSHSFLMVFRVLCGEWIESARDCMNIISPAGCIFYFLMTLTIGNFMVLNLFLALLLNAFTTENIQDSQSDEESKMVTAIKDAIDWCKSRKKQSRAVTPISDTHLSGSQASLSVRKTRLEVMIESHKQQVIANGSVHSIKNVTQSEDSQRTLPNGVLNNNTDEKAEEQEKPADGTTDENGDEVFILPDGSVRVLPCCCAVCHSNEALDTCCTPMWTAHRELWVRIVGHPVFEGFILLLIAASSITLCFEDNTLHEKQLLRMTLDYLNVAFAIIFFIEMLSKWLAYGIKKYFNDFWTILDFIIVMVAVIDLMGTYLGFATISAFKILRVLRALRPLRAVSRWQNMRIVVNALIFAMPAIGNVAVVVIVFWLIFAIMGVQNFKGVFYVCYYSDAMVEASGEADLISWACGNNTVRVEPFSLDLYNFATYNGSDWNHTLHKWPTDLQSCTSNPILKGLTWSGLCERLGGEWKRPLVHFDNVFYSYLALFQVATFEGWQEVMQSAIDAPSKIGGQGYTESNYNMYIYFIVFILVGTFFSLNLFIGVIIENFNNLKKKYDGSYLAAFLTENQRHYYNTLKKLGSKKPQKTIRRPKNAFQGFFYDIAVSTKFEISITFVILGNMILMMIDYLPAPDTDGGMLENGVYKLTDENQAKKDMHRNIQGVTEYINLVFTSIFLAETIVKLIGLRWHFFRRGWNVFDFIVVTLSLMDYFVVAGIALDQLFEGNSFISPTLLRVVRVFRIGRILRLVKAAKGIRKLLFALIISLPALFNIALLLFILMFIYAVMGMTMFGNVRHVDAITDTVNFSTFPSSIMLLFRLASVAGWNDILAVIMDPGSGCNSTHYIDTLGVPQPSSNGDCGNETVAIIYLVSYIFFSFMVIINMYIAVILENFENAHEQEEIGITDDDFDMFYVIWEKYDPIATQYIDLDQLSDFLEELEEPFNIPKPNGTVIVSFNLPIVEGDRVHCLDVLMALVKRALHTIEDESSEPSKESKEANEKLKQQIADKYREAFPMRLKIKVISTTVQRKKEDVAAKTLQRAWRKHCMKQNILRIRELALEQAKTDNVQHRFTEAFDNIKSRIGSAVSKFTRRPSTISTGSHSNQYAVHSHRLNSNTAKYIPRKTTHGYN